MKLEINGIQYVNFVSAVCEIRLDALSNSFRFDAIAPGRALPFKGGESCRVIINDKPVLTGKIEVVNVSYDAGEHKISISGRDKTADLLDSTIDSMDDIIGDNLTLKTVIEKVIEHIGADIKVIDEAAPEPFSLTEDIAAPEPGDNAFRFIEKFARRRQVLLTSNGDGDLVIAANSGQSTQGAIQHIIGATDNNVLSSEFSFDTTGRYHVYRNTTGLNPVAQNAAGQSDLASVVNQSGGVFDYDIKEGRQLVMVPESPYGSTGCKARAVWELNVRRARGLTYSAVVTGYTVGFGSDELWQVNKLYQITDDYLGKEEQMLCNSVTFTLSSTEGSKTALGFVGQRAYTAYIEPDPYAQEASSVA